MKSMVKLYFWLLWPPNTYGWINGIRADPVSSKITKANPGLVGLFLIFLLWCTAVLTQAAIVISLISLILI